VNPTPALPTADDDPRLMRAVQEYLAELEKGSAPDRGALAARYPDLADAMAPYLDALDMVHTAAPLLQQAATDRPAAEAIPTEPLGDFRIVREVGRGGMGIVYEAVQLSLGRRVALKVLPFAAALDAKQLQRFKNEAQAAAHLQHPNIVPVYFVGMERGVHFYAMQLIEGRNLAVLIEEMRQREVAGRVGESIGPFAASPASGGSHLRVTPHADTQPILAAQLSTQRSARAADFFRSAARLTSQAAEGLDFAHGVGIVHRDVKPANLLVDDGGNVWITDFGLAQVHTAAGLTQSGTLVGTLRYMSPEQAAGQRLLIDHRTDVYALGATLYELLTLRPIFDDVDPQALLHKVMHEEPRAPRSVDRSIPAELETIVLKAVAKGPAERYATARDFADDLQRFLHDEPIKARRATLAQRGRKWLRRHPSVLVTGVVLLVLLVAASVVSALLIRAAYERERQRAEVAETRFRLARRAVDEMFQLAEDEMASNPFLQDVRKRLLVSVLAYYQEFIEQRRDDPQSQAELAAIHDRVKKILSDLAVLQGAGHLHLLKDPAVLDDLSPSAKQRDQIAQLSQRMDEQRDDAFRSFHRLTPEEREQRFLDLARANEAAMQSILTEQQLQRFRQIVLHLQGAGAFRDAEVAKTLDLKSEQKKRLRGIETESMPGPADMLRPGFTPADMRKAHEEKQKTARARIQEVLNEDQRKLWREMTGEPFRGSIQFWFGPGPFGPPPIMKVYPPPFGR
jgi:serine/threonine protein kinase